MLHMAQNLVKPVRVCVFTVHSVTWGRKERKRLAEERRERGWRGGAERKGKREGREKNEEEGRERKMGFSMNELASFSVQPGVLCKNKSVGVRIFQTLGMRVLAFRTKCSL